MSAVQDVAWWFHTRPYRDFTHIQGLWHMHRRSVGSNHNHMWRTSRHRTQLTFGERRGNPRTSLSQVLTDFSHTANGSLWGRKPKRRTSLSGGRRCMKTFVVRQGAAQSRRKFPRVWSKKDDNSGSAASIWILYLKRKKMLLWKYNAQLVENSLVDPPHPNGAFPYTCQPGWTRRDLHNIWRCVFKWRTCVTCSVSQQRADWGRDLKERL